MGYIHIPLYRIIAALLSGIKYGIVILAKRRAIQIHINTEQIFYLIMSLHYILFIFLERKLGAVRMGIAMVSYVVSFGIDFFHLIWILINPVATQEKGCLNIIIFKYLQKLIGVICPPRSGQIKKELLKNAESYEFMHCSTHS